MSRIASVRLLIIYPILIALDILTTYLATPDLLYENNLIITTLNLKWGHIIFLSLLLATAIIYLVSKANSFFQNCPKNCARSAKFILYFIVLSFFFGHFCYTFYVIINNYLSYIYLTPERNSCFSEIATSYVVYYQSTPVYHHITLFSACLVGIAVSAVRIKLAFSLKGQSPDYC